MPAVWPSLLDLSRDECKRILRKLELEAYAGAISALRAQGDLTKEKKDLLGELAKVLSISTERHRAEVRRAVNDERLMTIAHHMSGPNSSAEWSIEGRRLVPLMPRLVPQTAFTVTANAVANVAALHNATLPSPAETGNKEVIVCYSYTSTTPTPASTTVPGGSVATVKSPRPASPASNVVVLPSGSTVYVKSVSCADEDDKPRKRRRTNSSSSSPVVLKEVPKSVTPVAKSIAVPMGSSPKVSNIMQSIANSIPSHMSPVKITFTKPTTQTTNTTTQKVIIVTTSPSSTFVPNILSKSHNYAAVTKLVPTSVITTATQRQPVVITATQPPFTAGSTPSPSSTSITAAATSMISSTSSVVMSTIAQGASGTAVKVTAARLQSPKALMGSPTQILTQFPKQQQQQQMSQSPQQQSQQSQTSPGVKPTIQIKQESVLRAPFSVVRPAAPGPKMMPEGVVISGVKIITQQMQPSKILPKPVTMPSTSTSPIMVVSSNGAIMTTKLVTTPTGTQTTYTRPTLNPTISARMAASTGSTTYMKTTSGSIITVVPKSLATSLGGKIISSSIMSGTTTKITTIPMTSMTSKPNVIVVQKTAGKGTTIQGIPGKNVVTTLLNAGGEKTIQAVPAGTKPAIITATRPITKMIVAQPKGVGSSVQPTTKIIPTKILYGQQGKTQVLIKPKPVAFQATMVSEQTRQLVSETLQQVSRVTEGSSLSGQEGSLKEEAQSFAEGSSGSGSSSDAVQISHGKSRSYIEIQKTRNNYLNSQQVVHVISSRSQDWTEHEVAMDTSPTIIYQDVSGEPQSATSTIKALLELQQTGKEKLESKSRQPTIDLSQMAVPIQMTQEKRLSPESPAITALDSELASEYFSSGKSIKPTVSSSSVGSGEVALTSLLPSGQQQQTAQPPAVMKSVPVSSAIAVTHILQQIPIKLQTVAGQGAVAKQDDSEAEESEIEEGDTLDPQTGLFYRSNTSMQPSHQQQKQLQQPQEVTQTKSPTLQQVSAATTQTQQTMLQVIAVKAQQPQQLPKLLHQAQQKPQLQPPTHLQHQPDKTQLTVKQQSVSLEQPLPGQAQPPIITPGTTVTKITFGNYQATTITKTASGSSESSVMATNYYTVQSSKKSMETDILKISMMEAQIEMNAEASSVDTSKERKPTAQKVSSLQSGPSNKLQKPAVTPVLKEQQNKQPPEKTLPPREAEGSGKAVQSHFLQIQNVTQEKSDEISADILIQSIPQYSIPSQSSSNVVVEPSGLLDITNFTSQRIADEESVQYSAMEHDVDSSNEEGTEPCSTESTTGQSH
ncbi:BRCA2-interacting transcriptional repressor EMSY isoform X1 [Carcharodon carcharias]|uniref:BRCA2-interacting transcriptional repressor EMSY isoform X1 n=1 Tax=Carcharodon carcharias TaxID=13397 RepID=UPI001B7E92AB|nr:BRCA2-interacting transcriptional repressor EMSY isoform X1 [Carcharodon carcharias]XP_041054945.1 BRCA2-interacting transcriptional repressor EMSY isoform X1 [Carcharodon carcharias]